MWDGEPIKDLLLLLGSDSLVFEEKVKKGGLKKHAGGIVWEMNRSVKI